MKIIADLHLHSKYSRATSKQLDIQNLERTRAFGEAADLTKAGLQNVLGAAVLGDKNLQDKDKEGPLTKSGLLDILKNFSNNGQAE